MFRIACMLLIFTSLSTVARPVFSAEGSKSWALYTWIDEDENWNYSLVRGTEKHPDGSEVKSNATKSLEGIKTRMSLLDAGSTIEINPLPVLNMEMHLPPGNTLKEFDRVCSGAKLRLVR